MGKTREIRFRETKTSLRNRESGGGEAAGGSQRPAFRQRAAVELLNRVQPLTPAQPQLAAACPLRGSMTLRSPSFFPPNFQIFNGHEEKENPAVYEHG